MTPIRIYKDGYRHGLIVGEGRKYFKAIWTDEGGIRIRKIERNAKYETLDYPVTKAVKILLAMGKKFGITKAAREALLSCN